jgi:uncharacterized protein YegJ (DUF2314 family)
MTDQPIYHVEGESDAFIIAAASARATFKFFWRELCWERRRIVKGLDIAAVKMSFAVDDPSGPSVENMWVTDVDFDGESISGVLMNEPQWVSTLNVGDAVSMPVEALNDWLYVLAGRPFGGFTIDALRAEMSAANRDAHDAAWGLDFGEVGTVELVPSGGQEPVLFSRELAGEADQLAFNKLSRCEHPMSINVLEQLDEVLQADPALISEYGDDGRLMIHREALAGNHDVVLALMRHGADPLATDQHGHTALTLAEAAGWPRVVELLQTGKPAASDSDESKGFPLWPIGLALTFAAVLGFYFLYFQSWLQGRGPRSGDLLASSGFISLALLLGMGLISCTGPWYFRLRLRTPMWGNSRALDLITMLGGFVLAAWLYDVLRSHFMGFN